MVNLLFLTTEQTSHAGTNIGNIIFNILSILLLFALLAKFAWSKLIDVLDEREKLVNDQLDDAEKNQKEALELLRQNQEKLTAAQAEIKEMMEKAREQSKVEKNAIISDAKEAASLLKDNARRDIEDEKNKALEEIQKQVAELSILIASKIIEKELDTNAQSALVDKIIKEVGDK